MARKYNNGSPETAETRDIPKDTLAAVNRRLAMSGSDFRLEPRAGDIPFGEIRESFAQAGEDACDMIKAAVTAAHPELAVVDPA